MPRGSSTSSSAAAVAAPANGGSKVVVPSSIINHTVEHNAIKNILDHTRQTISVFIDRINNNKEGVDADTVSRWRQQLETVITTISTLENSDSTMDQSIREILSKYLEMDVEEMVEVDENQIIEETRNLASEKATGQPQSQKMKELLAALSPSVAQTSDDDELIIQDDGGINEIKTKCPYTGKIMERPMKNQNGTKKCIHNVSLEGLTHLWRKDSECKCPVAGCRGKWSAATSVPDEAFKLKIERFLRRKELETQALLGHNAVDVEED